MARILVVEDDDYFRSALVHYLNEKKHIVTEAPNGKVAKEILAASDIDIILSDVQMPHCNGIELLEWAKANKPAPFILMTGFTNLLETKSAFELGADEFLAKPFKNDELMGAIQRITLKKNSPESVATLENLDFGFCKVSIEEFISKQQIEFDVYVRFSEQKYVKIGHKGDLIPRDRIYTYREKGIEFLHIRKEDFDKLVSFNLQGTRPVQSGDSAGKENRASLIKFTNETLATTLLFEGLDKTAYDDAKEFLGTAVQVLVENNEALDLLQTLKAHSDSIYKHSLGVALYAIMIARKMEFTSSQLFFKLGIAGIFHALGKKEISREILEKPAAQLSQKEREVLETYPKLGRDLLTALPGIPSDVTQLVYEHQEDNMGQGYPQKLDKNSLHPLSKILITANHFVEHALKSPNHPGMAPLAAIQQIETIFQDRLDRAVVQALRGLFLKSKP